MNSAPYLMLILAMGFTTACADEDAARPEPLVRPSGTTTQTNGTASQTPTTTTTGTGTQTQTQTQTPPATTPPAGTPAVTFAGFVKPLYLKACLGAGCHNTAAPADGIALETQAEAKAGFAASLKSIEEKKMPISRALLTADEIAKLKQWQAANFP